VGDLVQRGNITTEGYSRWSLGWRREKFVWEKHKEEQLLALITNVQDRLVWVGVEADQQEYTVKSGNNMLNK